MSCQATRQPLQQNDSPAPVGTSASGTGSAAGGALLMTVFWAGSVPTMLAVGLGAQKLFGPLRRKLPLVTAAAVVVLGLASIAGRLHAPVHPAHAMASDAR